MSSCSLRSHTPCVCKWACAGKFDERGRPVCVRKSDERGRPVCVRKFDEQGRLVCARMFGGRDRLVYGRKFDVRDKLARARKWWTEQQQQKLPRTKERHRSFPERKKTSIKSTNNYKTFKMK